MDILNLAPEQRLLIYNTLLGDPDLGAPIGSWEWDLRTQECLWSETTCAMIGLPPGTRMESTAVIVRMVHPEDLEYFMRMNEQAMATGEAPPLEYRIVRDDGSIRYLRARGQAIRDEAGNVIRMIGTVADITHQRDLRAQAATRTEWSPLDRILHKLHLVEPSGGGGGFLILSRVQLKLSILQYALLKALVDQQQVDATEPESVRGFISSSVLLVDLPWETPAPSNANLKQVIRKTRSILDGSGLRLESSRGLGYRLWIDDEDEAQS